MVRLVDGVDPTLAVIVSELTRASSPELVLLFGSRAAGSARTDSDYDLMVVFADDADLDAERSACARALQDARVSAEILARAAADYRRRQHDPGCLEWLVAREGRVIHTTGRIPQRAPGDRVAEGSEGLKEWLARVESDLRAAKAALAAQPPVLDAACFHAHQAVEKLLKTCIVKLGTFPPRTHDLTQLLDMQPESVRQDPELREACAFLKGLYPRSRYPELAMPSLDDARRTLDAAQKAVARLTRD